MAGEAASALLELALPSGVAVRFPAGTDPSYLPHRRLDGDLYLNA